MARESGMVKAVDYGVLIVRGSILMSTCAPLMKLRLHILSSSMQELNDQEIELETDYDMGGGRYILDFA